MKNADLPAMPGEVLNPEIGKLLTENREIAGLSLQEIKRYSSIQSGLTKREYFAGVALQGLLSNTTVNAHIGLGGADNQNISKACIAIANALLKELSND